MNKQEFQQTIKNMKCKKDCVYMSSFSVYQKGFEKAKELALLHSNSLDEPVKPKVPQFVADWYEEHKGNFEIFLSGLCINFTCHRERLNDKLANWYEQLENKPIQTLVNMHQFGYEVEKEQLYLASFRDTNQYLGWNEKLGEWFMSCSPFTSGVEQTQKTWEGVGIWNNPAFEIKEVEE